MGQLSRKLRNGGDGFLVFWCPGCQEAHSVATEEGYGPCWGYNGNPERPTFTPSILIRGLKKNPNWKAGDPGADWWERDASGQTIPSICHIFVTDGEISFLADCTHSLAGQRVEIPDLPPELRDPPEGTF